MKKLFLMIAALIVAASGALAQDFTVSARVGMNVANISGDGESMDAKIGVKFGLVGCFPLADNIYLEPGVFFAPKGAKKEWTTIDNNFMRAKNLNYLEIPINGVYKYEINNNLAVRGHFGPYFAIGMFGRDKYEINGSTKTNLLDELSEIELNAVLSAMGITADDVESIENAGLKAYKRKAFSSKKGESNYKRFDCGLNIGGGIEFSICYLGVQYSFGFVDFDKSNIKERNGVLSVDFGINF